MTHTMKIYDGGKLVEVVTKQTQSVLLPVKRSRSRRDFVLQTRAKRNGIGSNQYALKPRTSTVKEMHTWMQTLMGFLIIASMFCFGMYHFNNWINSEDLIVVEASTTLPGEISSNDDSGVVSKEETSETNTTAIATVTPTLGHESEEAVVTSTPTPTPTSEPSELPEILAYIATVFEPEGKHVVIRAINCFYSESGLRSDAVGHNKDKVRSTDYGVAQLNDYWHDLTEAQKTEIKANIDKAHDIYKSRGNFSAWYGKLCN